MHIYPLHPERFFDTIDQQLFQHTFAVKLLKTEHFVLKRKHF